MSSRSALLLSRGWLSKSAPASVVMSIRNGFSLLSCSLALCRKDHVSSTTNWTLLSRRDRASAWWSTRLWVRELHPVFEQDMAWRRVVSCRQPLPWHIPPTSSVASCDPRLLPKVSLYKGPSIASSCKNPRHSTNAMAPFSRAPLNLTIALFVAALSWVWRSCRSFFPRCACVCVCVFFLLILDIKLVRRTSRGHVGGRSHRIFYPPAFCGACLNFSREKDSAIPFSRRPWSRILCTNDLIVLHSLGIYFILFLVILWEKSRLPGSNSRPNVLEGYEVTSELPGRPVVV